MPNGKSMHKKTAPCERGFFKEAINRYCAV